MSLNLIQQAKDLFSGETIDQASSYFGETSSAISSAVAAIVPTIFSGLISKTENPADAEMVANLATNASNNGSEMANNISGLAGDSAVGSSVIATIFGNAGSGIANSIAKFAGIKTDTANSLMGMISTTVLSFLGRHMESNKMDANGLSNLLGSQRQNVAATMPAGLNLSPMLGEAPAVSATTAAHMGADRVTESGTATDPKYAADVDIDDAGNGLKWLIPVLLLALLSAGALYYFKGCNNKVQNGAHQDENAMHAEANHAENDSTHNAIMGNSMVDADGNYIYNVGDTTEIKLPNGAAALRVGQNSTEAKLLRFLQSNEAVDTAKGNWFDFTNVYFNSGKATITDASLAQLTNMAAIAKAYPKAQFKIGGYTDNTGDEAANISLSKSRAATVAAKLKALGATNIISSDGYGPQFAIGDNATEEGKAQNRRVSVNVKAK